jgi:hypothetical protein
MELPNVPFYFRIYSHNDQGIIYKALRQTEHGYDCQGTRQGGVVDGKIVWVMADYTDVMPSAAISTLLDLNKIGKRETTAIIRDNHLDPALGQMELYEDNGYLFESKNVSRSKSKSKSNSKNSNSKNSKNSKSKTKSKTKKY